MTRCGLLLAFFGVAVAFPAFPQVVSPDPVFTAIPFEQWVAEHEPSSIRWTTRISSPKLSNSQRLRVSVDIQVDGDELVKRRGRGELMMLVQFTDGGGRAYQAHKSLDLEDVQSAASKLNFVYTQDALVTPGDYQVSLGILDTRTREHSVVQRVLHVSPLRNDPLPQAWRDLPPVEILRDSPEDPFMPSVTGRLHLPVESRRPLQVELLVNVSAWLSQDGSRTRQTVTALLGKVISTLRVLSQMEVGNGSLNVALLDLSRQQVIFEQNQVRDLDLPGVEAALKKADPQKIDVRSLANRKQNAQFFVQQVSQWITRAPPGEVLPVLIVLSGPMTFDSGEDLRPIKPARKLGGKVFFVRIHAAVPNQLLLRPLEEPRFGRRGGIVAAPPLDTEPPDSLARTVKPLNPRLFDVYAPEELRKVLRNLLDEISGT
jgi:hypothetical protein